MGSGEPIKELQSSLWELQDIKSDFKRNKIDLLQKSQSSTNMYMKESMHNSTGKPIVIPSYQYPIHSVSPLKTQEDQNSLSNIKESQEQRSYSNMEDIESDIEQ